MIPLPSQTVSDFLSDSVARFLPRGPASGAKAGPFDMRNDAHAKESLHPILVEDPLDGVSNSPLLAEAGGVELGCQFSQGLFGFLKQALGLCGNPKGFRSSPSTHSPHS